MTRTVLSAGLLAVALLSGGCATKKYVRNTTAPIQAKVDQVGETTQKQGQEIQETQGQVKQVDEKAQSGISAAKEQAMTAQNHAAEAMTRANQAADMAKQDSEEIANLRQVVANIDDYKQVSDLTIRFAFNKYMLTAQDKEELDQMVANASKNKRYFIAVEGYTDRTGTRAYNAALSRKRADAVTEYLVAKHDIPIYRIHMIGLGDENPVDTAHTRSARAKNRRVEVKIFSADQSAATADAQQPSQPAPTPQQ
jgi:OmpA-OmpF porin, OOP family